MSTLKNVLMRIVAVIAAEALGVIGAGSLVGIETWKAAVLAGALGAATVVGPPVQRVLPLLADKRVECGEWFVEQQDLRVDGKCAGETDALLHAA